MDKTYLKKDLIKAFILTAFFILLLIVLLYLDNKYQIFEGLSQRFL